MPAEALLRDVRVGLRILAKERAFCALAIFVLAVGIAAVTTQFGVVNGIMLRGFSFPNAVRLMNVRFTDPSSATIFGLNGQISEMDFEEFRYEQKSFERLAAYLNGSTVNVTANGIPKRYTGAYVTEDFFRILGVTPLLGRDFTSTDNKAGAPKIAIISYGLWQRDFAGASNIVGTPVRINGGPGTIIGVMPQGFTFPVNEELWLPLYSEFPVRARNDPLSNNPAVMGLIKPGVSAAQAQAEITGFAERFAKAYPDTNKPFTAGLVEPLINAFTNRPLRGTLWTMLAFCAGVLLIACVNVMNMQFARATLRARELAVRSSIGATRSQLMRQMLTESALLAGAGALLGIGLAYFLMDWFSATVRAMENPPPAWMTFTIDLPVLTFTVGATVTAAIASGLLPAWMASRLSAASVLRDGGRGATGRVGLMTRGLVVLQIVMTCVLLIGSLLQVRSIVHQQKLDYGYDTAGILSARMGLMDADYPTTESRKIFYDRLIRELRESPQFEAAALTSRFQMVFSGSGPIEIDGVTYKDRRDRPRANFEQISPTFFDVTRQKILDGRGFTDADLDSTRPIAIVNAAFAKKFFGTESAIGRRFRTGDGSTPQYGPWRTIVGVVTTIRMLGPFNNPNVDDSGFYVPFYSVPFGADPGTLLPAQFATVIVKPHPGQRADTLADALRREVKKVDPNLPLYFVATPKRNSENVLSGPRIIAVMFSMFGVVAVLLAAVGIYGVMSFAVNRRTQEFGVRMALGADARSILKMVLAQGSRQVALGLVLGFGVALLVGTLGRDAITSALFDVSPRDPLTYSAVFVTVTLVSLLALVVPGRRATHVDPIIALRGE